MSFGSVPSNFNIKIPAKIYAGFTQHVGFVPQGMICQHGTDAKAKRRMDQIDRHTHLPAVDFENIPRYGFRVSRKSLSMGFRSQEYVYFEDPYGFEVMVMVQNVVQLYLNNMIHNGEILQPCVWGMDGVSAVLLPVNSAPYLEAIENTTRSQTTQNIRSVKPGNTVLLKSGQHAIYYGKMYVSYTSESYTIQTSDKPEHLYAVFDLGVTDYTSDKFKLVHKHSTISKVLDDSEKTISECEIIVNDITQMGKFYTRKSFNMSKMNKFLLLHAEPMTITDYSLSEITDLTTIDAPYKKFGKRFVFCKNKDANGDERQYVIERDMFQGYKGKYGSRYMRDWGTLPSDVLGAWVVESVTLQYDKFSINHSNKKETIRLAPDSSIYSLNLTIKSGENEYTITC